MTTWKPGLRCRRYSHPTATGTVAWVGRSKRGSLRVGVRLDSNPTGPLAFFTPGVTLWGSFIEITEGLIETQVSGATESD